MKANFYDTQWGRLTTAELARRIGVSRGALVQRLLRGWTLDDAIAYPGRFHGKSTAPIYRQWAAMVQRCTNPNLKCWSHYGGRGITLHPPWRKFAAFYRDMGAAWKPGLSIDRIDNDAGYAPDNCRWSTRSEQLLNTRRTNFVDSPWGRVPLAVAAQCSGIHRTTILSRIKARTDPFR